MSNISEALPKNAVDTPADLIVVPARFGSSRLPGKPLLQIAGRTLLERVVAVARAAARQAGECDVVVATDDARIADHAQSRGVDVAMTAPELDSGTSRAFAAASQRPIAPKRIVNLQGDAPFIPASIVAGLMLALRGGTADVATPVFQLDWPRLDRLRAHKQTAPFSGTTCVRAANGNALWFSKTIVPALRNEDKLRAQPLSPVWQHLGLYGYSFDALRWFASASPGTYEILEGLEQLRFLENGWTITTVPRDSPFGWNSHPVKGVCPSSDLKPARENGGMTVLE